MSQRNRNIILWIVAIGLLVSMVISFTPGSLFGNRGAQQEAAEGPVALTVNGEPIRELQVQRLEQNPPFNTVQEGPVAQDLQLVLLDQLVTQTLLQQAAADVNVSSGEVRERVNEFREQQGVAGSRNDRAYQNLLAGAGYTDATFRDLTRQQLQQEKYLDNLTADTKPTDAEIQTYYEANQQAYQSEPRITAREIVVADESKANALYAQALAGADFAGLARDNSTERAEQGGALGAAEGESTPQPVTSVALPTAVSQAAFALQGPGLTAPIQAGGVYHIVKVEAYTPAGTRPLTDVRSEVEKDLTDLQKAAAEENALRTLKASADVVSPAGSSYQYKDAIVATVGDRTITAAELDRNTYLNPQIQQLLNPSFAGIIESSIKPNILTQMIDTDLAVQGAKSLKGTFIGPDSAVAQSALGYVSRDVKVTPAQVQSFYKGNKARYTDQPSALTTRVNFPGEAAARDFRQALTTADAISTDSIGIAAEAAGGSVQDLGNVSPGSQPEAIDSVLFNFQQGMTALGQSGFDISNVLTLEVPATSASGGAASGGAVSGGVASGGAVSGGTASGGATAGATVPTTREQFVVLIAARTPESVRPFDTVRAQARQAALQQQQNQAQQSWLDGLREKFPVTNLLASAQTPSNPQSGGAQSGGVQSGGVASGGAPVGNVPSETPNPETASGGAQNGATQNGAAPEGSSPNPQGAQNENARETAQPGGETEAGNTANGTQSSGRSDSVPVGGAQNGATQGQNSNVQETNQNNPAQNSVTPDETQGNTTSDADGVADPGETAPGKAAPSTLQENPKPTGGAAQNGTPENSTGSEPRQNNAQSNPLQTKPNTQGNETRGNETQGTTPQNSGAQNGGSTVPIKPVPIKPVPTKPAPAKPAPTSPGNSAN